MMPLYFKISELLHTNHRKFEHTIIMIHNNNSLLLSVRLSCLHIDCVFLTIWLPFSHYQTFQLSGHYYIILIFTWQLPFEIEDYIMTIYSNRLPAVPHYFSTFISHFKKKLNIEDISLALSSLQLFIFTLVLSAKIISL